MLPTHHPLVILSLTWPVDQQWLVLFLNCDPIVFARAGQRQENITEAAPLLLWQQSEPLN